MKHELAAMSLTVRSDGHRVYDLCPLTSFLQPSKSIPSLRQWL
ncbi:hypothetical protein GA0061100_11885 [Rhizobium hainanense]|uniref:Uncharacterized protein n=1 Tax=Rhizobium hainanense TaxID=52131 RepID=A0A1C3WGX6_9HYPH|nr:hypothetical protein GA0061100_11885 [Rhizobium hainanense]